MHHADWADPGSSPNLPVLSLDSKILQTVSVNDDRGGSVVAVWVPTAAVGPTATRQRASPPRPMHGVPMACQWHAHVRRASDGRQGSPLTSSPDARLGAGTHLLALAVTWAPLAQIMKRSPSGESSSGLGPWSWPSGSPFAIARPARGLTPPPTMIVLLCHDA